jgi:hypothetical protein
VEETLLQLETGRRTVMGWCEPWDNIWDLNMDGISWTPIDVHIGPLELSALFLWETGSEGGDPGGGRGRRR